MAKPDFGMDCKTCPCFEKIPKREDQPYGECRLNPPAVLMITLPHPVIGANQPPECKPLYAWPIVQETQHCWQYPAMKSLQNALIAMKEQHEKAEGEKLLS